MNRVIYVIGVLAILTSIAILPDMHASLKIGVGGALLILVDIVYENLYGE